MSCRKKKKIDKDVCCRFIDKNNDIGPTISHLHLRLLHFQQMGFTNRYFSGVPKMLFLITIDYINNAH
jgi:hypothetical protein